MEKLYTSKTFLKMANGWMHTLRLPPGSAPGHKLQKPSKSLTYFSHLLTWHQSRRQSSRLRGARRLSQGTKLSSKIKLVNWEGQAPLGAGYAWHH